MVPIRYSPTDHCVAAHGHVLVATLPRVRQAVEHAAARAGEADTAKTAAQAEATIGACKARCCYQSARCWINSRSRCRYNATRVVRESPAALHFLHRGVVRSDMDGSHAH